MKILYVATVSATIDAFLVPHINMLVEEGHQVDVACHYADQLDERLQALGCQAFEVAFERTPFDRQNIQAYKEVDRILSEGQYDIVHTHTPVASAIVRLASRKHRGTQVFYTAHGFHIFKGAPLSNWLMYFPTELLLSRLTDLIITINQEDFDRANKYFKTSSNDVVYVKGVGINLDKFAPLDSSEKARLRRLNNLPIDLPILIYVGELSHRKNQAFLLDVVATLRPEVDFHLLLIGDGPEEDNLKQKAVDLGIDDVVSFLGHRYDVPILFGLSDICVSSSRQEGLAVNLMEAMGSGLPLVVTNVRGNRDLVEEGVNGYIVPEHDVELFAERVKSLVTQPDKAVAMGEVGHEMVQELDIESINQSLLAFFQEHERISGVGVLE